LFSDLCKRSYQDILEEGREEGEEKGLQKGRREGEERDYKRVKRKKLDKLP
jgi:predicted transposase YdaD